MLRRDCGYTLLEVVVVVAIVAILANLSVPGLGATVRTQQGETLLNELARQMAFARSSAVTHGQNVTLCRDNGAGQCGSHWNSGVLVFVDNDSDGVLDAGEELLRQAGFRTVGTAATVKLRSFPNRQYVQFTPLGFTRGQSGSFTWCPPDGNTTMARQLIFTQTGRTRVARDSDGDGVREGADGTPLACE